MENSLLQLNLISEFIHFTPLCNFVTKLHCSNLHCVHDCFHEERFYGSYHFGDNTAYVQVAVRRLFIAFFKLHRASLALFFDLSLHCHIIVPCVRLYQIIEPVISVFFGFPRVNPRLLVTCQRCQYQLWSSTRDKQE